MGCGASTPKLPGPSLEAPSPAVVPSKFGEPTGVSQARYTQPPTPSKEPKDVDAALPRSEPKEPKAKAPDAPPPPRSLAFEGPPGPVTNLRMDQTSRKFVSLEWEPPLTGVLPDSYEARLHTADGEDAQLIDVWRAKKTSCRMNGLRAASTYSIAVLPISETHGKGPMSWISIEARLAPPTRDEAAATITAGMTGLYTRRQIQRGNAMQFADPNAQAKKASRRRSKRRGRKAAELSNDDAALLVQTQVRRHQSVAKYKQKRDDTFAIKENARRAVRDICNGMMLNIFGLPDCFGSIDTVYVEMLDLSSAVVQSLFKRVARHVGEEKAAAELATREDASAGWGDLSARPS